MPLRMWQFMTMKGIAVAGFPLLLIWPVPPLLRCSTYCVRRLSCPPTVWPPPPLPPLPQPQPQPHSQVWDVSSKEERKKCVTKLVDVAKARGVRLPEVTNTLESSELWGLVAICSCALNIYPFRVRRAMS